MKTGIELITEERHRQIEKEGWTAEHDAEHTGEQIAEAAAMYALPAPRRTLSKNNVPVMWPWGGIYWKPTPEDRIRELQKAGALIAAEIDRIQELEKPTK